MDRRIADLERRFRETGAVADEVRLIRARLRAGDLAWDKLALAAFVEREAAVIALGEAEREAAAERTVLRPLANALRTLRREEERRDAAGNAVYRCVGGLHAWGSVPLGRAAAAIVRHVLDASEGGAADEPTARAALAAIEAWCRVPSADGARAAYDASLGRSDAPASRLAREAATALSVFGRRIPAPKSDLMAGTYFLGLALRRALRIVDAAPLGRAIRDAIGAWALGYADPLGR